MPMLELKRLVLPLRALLLSCSGATAALGVSMARPWADPLAYAGPRDYLALACFVLWAISPNLLLVLRAAHQLRAGGAAGLVFLLVASLGPVFWLWVYIDTALIHPDPQGGLVFLFVPLWHWLLVLVLLGACGLIRWLQNRA